MSSTYRVLCLSHDPATVAADGDWNRPEQAEEAIAAGVEGHEQCDLLIGRYSYPLVEVGCPASKDRRFKHPCVHGGTQWVDVAWLALLAVAQQDPSSAEAPSALRVVAREAGARCWSPERVRRLGPALGVTAAAEPKLAPSDVAELEQRLVLAHQSRRASEHTLDGVRRALCDAGFMQDGDPYGHADLADVIRQAGEASVDLASKQADAWEPDIAVQGLARALRLTREYIGSDLLPAVKGWDWFDALHRWAPEQLPQLPTEPVAPTELCGDPGPAADDPSNPCTLPLGHDVHRDQDGCSRPTPAVPVEAQLYSGQVEPLDPPTIPPCHIDHDCPGQVRKPPRRGCAAWDRGERHPAHQWYSSTRGRVSCNGEPPFGEPLRGDRVRVTYEADWDEVLSSGGRMVLAGNEPGNRYHNVVPDSAIVEVIGRAGDGA